ncbi:MAG: TIGR03943 family protein [Oscillospiraceae bacterium]|nr:TIGR03943 family protein [Oscillospiraceae bacterium]
MNTFVYLFTGFLEAGKTKFIQEVLSGQELGGGGNTLLLICEEGMEEYDPSEFVGQNIYCEIIEDQDELNPKNLTALKEKYNATLVLVEYNGMWQIDDFFNSLPDSWMVYQEMMIADATTFEIFNRNMRSLVYDKLSSCDLVTFNRVTPQTDRMALHKIVRGANRNVQILYELTDGTIEPDTMEDPLPFDMDAEVITIRDRDFAYFYRELASDPKKFEGRTVKFKGLVYRDNQLPKDSFICGRHVMTCCADDIRYNAVACKWKSSTSLQLRQWVMVTGKIAIQKHQGYAKPGPVIHVSSLAMTSAPSEELATFY